MEQFCVIALPGASLNRCFMDEAAFKPCLQHADLSDL
jgi:hypothetical protein